MSHKLLDVNNTAVVMNRSDQAECAAADIEHNNPESVRKSYLIGGSESVFNVRKCLPRGIADSGTP
jgi:hypothetical protein